MKAHFPSCLFDILEERITFACGDFYKDASSVFVHTNTTCHPLSKEGMGENITRNSLYGKKKNNMEKRASD